MKSRCAASGARARRLLQALNIAAMVSTWRRSATTRPRTSTRSSRASSWPSPIATPTTAIRTLVKIPAERLLSGLRRAASRPDPRAGVAGDAATPATPSCAAPCCRLAVAARPTRSTPATWRSSTPRATASRPRRAIPTSARRRCLRRRAAWSRRAARRAGSIPTTPAWWRRASGPASRARAGQRRSSGGKLMMPFGTRAATSSSRRCCRSFLNTTVFGTPPQEAIEAPRLASRSFPDPFWPHAYSPGKLEAERRIPKETRDALVGMGHEVAEWPDWEWRAGSGLRGQGWGGGRALGRAPTPAAEPCRSPASTRAWSAGSRGSPRATLVRGGVVGTTRREVALWTGLGWAPSGQGARGRTRRNGSYGPHPGPAVAWAAGDSAGDADVIARRRPTTATSAYSNNALRQQPLRAATLARAASRRVGRRRAARSWSSRSLAGAGER
mgnify:CR=1 FL=1